VQVSQEKLIRALASEKQVARRLSSGGSVCSATSTLFNTANLPSPMSPSPFCSTGSLSSSASFSVLRDSNNKTILLPPRHHGRASSLSLPPTANSSGGAHRRNTSAGSGETGEAVPSHRRLVDTPGSALSSDLGDDNLLFSDAFGDGGGFGEGPGKGADNEGPIRDDVSEVSFATTAAAVCPMSASRRRASFRVSR
jgi:hypothetical protein